MSSPSDRHIERAKEIMDGRVGKENSITSGDMREMLNIDENETTPRTRAVITHLVKEEGMPIVARTGRPAGYFIAETEDEIYEYVGTLTSRINEIDDRRTSVLEAAQGADHLDLASDEFDEDIL